MEGDGLERIGMAPPALRCCPHCRGMRLQRWGATARGLARLRCSACRRTFSPRTGSLASGLRLRVAFERAFEDMLGAEPSSCRVLAARLGVHRMTVWRWRIRVLGRFVRAMPAAGGVDVNFGAGAVCTRESRKASREWVNHARWPALFPPPPRPRWRDLARGESPPGGWAAWRVSVPIVVSGAERSEGSAHIQVGRSGPAGVRDGSAGAGFVVGQAPRLQRRFDRFLAPFCGPATRHLQGYVAWMIVRDAVRASSAAA